MAGCDTRRSFLERSLLPGARLWPLKGAARSRIKVSASQTPTLAKREMLRGLLSLRLPAEVRFENPGEAASGLNRIRSCISAIMIHALRRENYATWRAFRRLF
jgi:hypothetical protein